MATTDDSRREALQLAQQTDQMVRVSGRQPLRAAVRWITRGRYGHRHGWPVIPEINAPWQDTVSHERDGWRMRAANLHGDRVFAVDYVTCRRCGLGWVEMPHTSPEYQRCGLAAAGLAALRAEHSGLFWHTLGGHFRDSIPFWASVGARVPGGYQQKATCSHISDY